MRLTSLGAGSAPRVGFKVRSLKNRALSFAKDQQDAAQTAFGKLARRTTDERRDDLVAFYDRYEELVETLCDAAQYGPTPKLESSYASQRGAYLETFREIQPFVVSFLTSTEDDFVALASQATLADFLSADDGEMIGRITSTREALTLYGEHLRQLAARGK